MVQPRPQRHQAESEFVHDLARDCGCGCGCCTVSLIVHAPAPDRDHGPARTERLSWKIGEETGCVWSGGHDRCSGGLVDARDSSFGYRFGCDESGHGRDLGCDGGSRREGCGSGCAGEQSQTEPAHYRCVQMAEAFGCVALLRSGASLL